MSASSQGFGGAGEEGEPGGPIWLSQSRRSGPDRHATHRLNQEELPAPVAEHDDDPVARPQVHKAAEEHGWMRAQQGYSVELLLEEIRILRRVLLQHVQANLLGVSVITEHGQSMGKIAELFLSLAPPFARSQRR